MRRLMLWGALIFSGLLFWLVRREEDVGEAFCDMDQIDADDPGEDIDERAT